MSKEMGIVALGIWVVVMPYLGIYRSWLTLLMVATGIALMVIGFLLRGEAIMREHHTHVHTPTPRKRSRTTFQESAPKVEHDYSAHTDSNLGSLN
jgi:hypothetical protein